MLDQKFPIFMEKKQVFGKVRGYVDAPYNWKLNKNRSPSPPHDCLEGYSEDIYDESIPSRCLPNAKPVHIECRCKEKLLSCPKYMDGNVNMLVAVDCVVKGVYPIPNSSFQIKQDSLRSPAALIFTNTCEHSPDEHSTLTVRCRLSLKDFQQVQKEFPQGDLIFEVQDSFGNHSEHVTRLPPLKQQESQSTGDITSIIISVVAIIIIGVLVCVIIYLQRKTGGAAPIDNTSLGVQTISRQVQNSAQNDA